MDRLEESGDRVADALRAGKVSIPALEGEPDAAGELATEEKPSGPTSESLESEGGENSVALTEKD